MTRDLGPKTAWEISTSHEYWDYGKDDIYQPGGTNVTTTLAEATNMDFINNNVGIAIGKNIPFYYSDEKVAQIIIEDMKNNLESYCALETNVDSKPTNGW